MPSRPALILPLALAATPAHADDCTQRLRALLATDLTADGPYTAMNTTMMGGLEQVFRQSFVSDRHFLVEPLHPPGIPATLHYEGGAWLGDGDGGWTLSWETDPDGAAADIAAHRTAMAEGLQTATCTEADGTETLTGAVGPTPQFGPEVTVGYIVDATTGQILELSYVYVLNGMPVTARYEISRAPGLALPVPPGG